MTNPNTDEVHSTKPTLNKSIEMTFKSSTTTILVLLIVIINNVRGKVLQFPPGFKLGVATASYQVEGAWNSSGKGENIWDRLTHTHSELITDHTTGDIACDSYHLYREDINNLKTLRVDHYRFSLSWSRLLPDGFANKVNPHGVDYYSNLIDALIDNKIEPMVTLYHWDLPQTLQDLGGWTNPDIARYFEDFADVAFGLFGDRVKKWITINEPSSICVGTYEDDDGAPHVSSPGIGLYWCGRTILMAHARAYRLYEAKYKGIQRGKVGITIDSIWAEPKSNSTIDHDAAERQMQMELGWWAHPIFHPDGDYPPLMKTRVDTFSKLENFTESRLPRFTQREVKFIKRTFDFFGVNHYNTWLVTAKEAKLSDPPSYVKDKGTLLTKDQRSKMAPWGFRKLLNWIKREYQNPLVIVTENGYGDGGGNRDLNRTLFLKEYMKAVLLATVEDGCNIGGYTVWSLMDNMEWRSGYTIKFGLYDVDFSPNGNRTRTPKASASFYQSVIKTRTIPEKYD